MRANVHSVLSRRATARLGCLAAILLAGCASGPPAGSAVSLQLPTAGTVRTLAQTTMYTSPDGGIYQNPDPLQVIMVARAPGTVLASLLPSAQPVVSSLQQLGDLTFIGLRIRNDGKAGSDAQLGVAQIASDYAPRGTASGALRQYYHPMFAIALLSPASSDSTCTVHVDPGETVTVVLVYPPIRSTATIVWGEYHSFALRAPVGGALPAGTQHWQATPCVPPVATGS